MNYRQTVILILIYVLVGTLWLSAGDTNKKNVPQSADNICPLLVGRKIPTVTLKTVDGKSFNLNEAIGQKPTVLIFYRGGWCPYCNLHLNRLKEIEQKLLDLGYQLIAVSTDRPQKLKETLGKNAIKYTLLSDNKMTASRAFGLAFKVPDELVKKYKNQYKIDLEDASGETHHLLPVPAAFIIGTDGVIKFGYINPDYKVRVEPMVLLAAAEAYSHPSTSN